MFSFFKKKEAQVTVPNTVFTTRESKWGALLQLVSDNPAIALVGWFDDSVEKLQLYLHQKGRSTEVISYRNLHTGMIGNSDVVFIEHYPLAAKEQEVFQSLTSKKVSVYCSLDEPFFRHFGGDRITALLNTIGMKENEGISHPLVNKSIMNAQSKLGKQVIIEQSARSQEEWMQKNIGTITR